MHALWIFIACMCVCMSIYIRHKFQCSDSKKECSFQNTTVIRKWYLLWFVIIHVKVTLLKNLLLEFLSQLHLHHNYSRVWGVCLETINWNETILHNSSMCKHCQFIVTDTGVPIIIWSANGLVTNRLFWSYQQLVCIKISFEPMLPPISFACAINDHVIKLLIVHYISSLF